MTSIDANDLSFLLAVFGVLGIIFAIYRQFKEPQIKSDKADTLFAIQIKTMQADLVNLRDNHIHSLGLAIEQTNKNVNTLTLEVTKLGTILEERLPRK
jgi:hypothetical protein